MSSVLLSDLVQCASECELNSLDMRAMTNLCPPTAINGAMFRFMQRILNACGSFAHDCQSGEDDQNVLVSKVPTMVYVHSMLPR